MPTTKEEENAAIAKAMGKLMKDRVAVKILRNPFQLARVREDLVGFRESKQYVSKRSWVSSFFRRKALFDNTPLDAKIKAFEMLEQKLSGEYIEGFLTPLKEAEVWDVRIEVAAIIKTLRLRDKEFEGEALEAWKIEVSQASNSIWASKWVELAFKKTEQVAGAWIRYYNTGETVHAPETVEYLFALYHQSFSLDEEELKKSVASTPPAN